ncbi:U6 snRNA-associated Sm-like protein LSm2 [Zalerion maritima]|uniref:U6 snRNA-associated Sm-like protein LSm2 n=1 Tax=Zalerion maritima TaxID=339359 RepID=A0AAD5WSG4_9PEZI|nr:U6 snRNA-associated Sm-like protein LSm2 [Zalerion maritima]
MAGPHMDTFFKTLIDHEVTVELKNDIQVRGILKSVDQYLNIKLDDIQVVEEIKYPHLSSVKNVFIRGSVVRYVHLPANSVDVALLEDATRRGDEAKATGLRSLSRLDGLKDIRLEKRQRGSWVEKERKLHRSRVNRPGPGMLLHRWKIVKHGLTRYT